MVLKSRHGNGCKTFIKPAEILLQLPDLQLPELQLILKLPDLRHPGGLPPSLLHSITFGKEVYVSLPV